METNHKKHILCRSAERYDQREGVWVRLPSMNTSRGCHALTVLGESLSVTSSYSLDLSDREPVASWALNLGNELKLAV